MTEKTMTTHTTVEDVWQTIHQFSPEDFDRFTELFELEKRARAIVAQTGDPFQALVGTWSDEDVDEFNVLIEESRKRPPREISFDRNDDKP